MRPPLISIMLIAFVLCASVASAQNLPGGSRISPSTGHREASFDQLRILGDAAMKKGELDQAETYYRQALDLIPMPGVQFKLAKVFEKKKLKNEALALFRQLTDEKANGQLRNDPVVLAEYGEAALASGLSQEAQSAFERAVANGRDSLGADLPKSNGLAGPNGIRAAAWLAAGHQLTLTGQPEDAATAYERAVKAQPKSDVARFYHATALAKVGRGHEAASTFKSLRQSADPTVRREATRRSG